MNCGRRRQELSAHAQRGYGARDISGGECERSALLGLNGGGGLWVTVRAARRGRLGKAHTGASPGRETWSSYAAGDSVVCVGRAALQRVHAAKRRGVPLAICPREC